MNKRWSPYLLLVSVMAGWVALCDLSLVIGTWQDNSIPYRDQLERFGASWASLAVWGALGTLLVLLLSMPVSWLARRRWPLSRSQVATPLLAALAALAAFASVQCWLGVLIPLPEVAFEFITGAVAMAAAVWVAQKGVPARFLALNIRLAAALALPALTGLTLIASDALTEAVEPAGTAPGPVPQYVFLLSVDSLSAQHMSVYGYSRDTTPNLNQFAQQATVFDRMYASSNWTVPGMASLITGTRPWAHRGLNFSSGPLVEPFESGLFSMTKALGYSNSAYVTNFNASPQTHGGRKWFDRIRYPLADSMSFGLEWPWRVFDRQPRVGGTEMTIYDAVDEVLGRLGLVSSTDNRSPAATFDSLLADLQTDQQQGGQHLYWAHFYPPHYPYAAPAPFLGKFDGSGLGRTRFDTTPKTDGQANSAKTDPLFPVVYGNRYDESVAYIDAEFGRFFAELKRRGIYDQSLIIITSDHGESFSHGCTTHAGACLHDEVIRIPLLIKRPGQTAPQRIQEAMEQADLLPTLGALFGLVPGDQSLWQGVSMLPAMEGESSAHLVFSMNLQDSYRRSELPSGSIAVIDGPWKFVHHFGYRPDMYPVSLENALYNLTEDPDENSNVARQNPEVAARLMATVYQRLQAHKAVRYGH